MQSDQSICWAHTTPCGSFVLHRLLQLPTHSESLISDPSRNSPLSWSDRTGQRRRPWQNRPYTLPNIPPPHHIAPFLLYYRAYTRPGQSLYIMLESEKIIWHSIFTLISQPTVKICADCNFFCTQRKKKIRDWPRTIPVFIYIRYIICLYQFSDIVGLHRLFINFQYGCTLAIQTEHISAATSRPKIK